VAKKRKNIEEAERSAYKPPEFDEKEYLEEQLLIGRGVIISVIWGIIIGIATLPLYHQFMDQWTYIFIPGVIGLGALYFILPPLKVKLTNINKKSWFNFLLAFGLTWFAVLTISLNPPFSDFSDPILDDNTLEKQEFNPAMFNTTPLMFRAEIKDNYILETPEVNIIFPPQLGIGKIDAKMIKGEDNNYFYSLTWDQVNTILDNQNPNIPLGINYTITAKDSRGNKVTSSSVIRIYEHGEPLIRNIGFDDNREIITITLQDNSEFDRIYFLINSKNGEDTDDDEEYEFEYKNEVYNSQDKAFDYEYHFPLELFKKGSYNVTITAVDSAGNSVQKGFSFTMSEHGSDVGKDDGGGLLPGFGMVETFGAVFAILFIALIVKKRNR